MVVVELAGTAGTVVVVVLVVVGAEVQPVSDTRAAAATQRRMNFFIDVFVVCFFVLQAHGGVFRRPWLSGVTLPWVSQ